MALRVALTPRKSAVRSGVWTVLSAVWLLIVSDKLQRMRSAGGYVSPIRYGIVVFWALMVAFWIANLLRDLKRTRAEAVGKVS